MAKDDYDVIVYRVLVYYYACLKRKIMFDAAVFDASVKKDIESDAYFFDVLRMMQNEGLIEGLDFANAWGGDIILISELSDARITADGIHYLKENSSMRRVADMLKTSVDIIANLAGILQLF